jgi:hypothetical protein
MVMVGIDSGISNIQKHFNVKKVPVQITEPEHAGGSIVNCVLPIAC